MSGHTRKRLSVLHEEGSSIFKGRSALCKGGTLNVLVYMCCNIKFRKEKSRSKLCEEKIEIEMQSANEISLSGERLVIYELEVISSNLVASYVLPQGQQHQQTSSSMADPAPDTEWSEPTAAAPTWREYEKGGETRLGDEVSLLIVYQERNNVLFFLSGLMALIRQPPTYTAVGSTCKIQLNVDSCAGVGQ